jgi:hypothetical protein
MAYHKLNNARTYASLNASTATTVAGSNVFTPILGTFTNSPLVDFDIFEGKLRYIGKKDQEFEIDWSSSFFSSVNFNTVHVGISINSEVITIAHKSVLGIYEKTALEVGTLGGTWVVTLSENDTVELQIAGSVASDVTVDHFTTTIRRFV